MEQFIRSMFTESEITQAQAMYIRQLEQRQIEVEHRLREIEVSRDQFIADQAARQRALAERQQAALADLDARFQARQEVLICRHKNDMNDPFTQLAELQARVARL